MSELDDLYDQVQHLARQLAAERAERVRLAQLLRSFLLTDRTTNWNLTYDEMDVLESLAQVPIG